MLDQFFINVKLAFINDPRILPRNPPDSIIAYICVFNDFQVADELFARTFQRLETCLLGRNNLYGKLVASFVSLVMFCYIFKVSFLLFFVGDFDLSRFLVAVYNKDKNTVESNKLKHDMFLKNALS